MRFRGVILASGLAAVVAVGAFFGARYAIAQFTADAQEGPAIPASVHDEVEREMNKALFAGQRLGIFIAPSEDAVPAGYSRWADFCVEDAPIQNTRYSADQAGVLALDFEPPLGYELDAGNADTVVSACDGRAVVARRYYEVEASNGLRANVVVGRGLFKYDTIKAAAERVYVANVGGREAVIVEPVAIEGLPEAMNSASAIYFPESFGNTFIHAFDLPKEQLIALAEAVAQGTRR